MFKLQSTDGIQPCLDVFYSHGMWPKRNSSVRYMIYYTLIVIVFIVIYMVSIAGSFFQLGNLANSTDRIYVNLTVILFGIKYALFISKRGKINRFMDTLKKDLKVISKDAEETIIIESAIKRSRIMIILARIVYFVAIFLSIAAPLFIPGRTLPYKAYLPFEWESSLIIYTVVYLYQVIGIYFESSVNAVLDIITPCALTTVGGYFDALGHNFRKLGWTMNVDEKMERQRFNILVGKYTNLKRIIDSIEDIFSEMLFIQFSVGGVILCLTGFKMTLVKF